MPDPARRNRMKMVAIRQLLDIVELMIWWNARELPNEEKFFIHWMKSAEKGW
jgi:hypothetical protein